MLFRSRSPIAIAVPNIPSARAHALWPIAIATLVGVLVHSELLPMPKNEAQVAWAVGAAARPAAMTGVIAAQRIRALRWLIRGTLMAAEGDITAERTR